MMRITTIIFTGGVLGALTSWASPGLEGSKHDFSGKEWSSGSSCAACHTPHQENPPEAAPLWDADADLSSRFGSSLGARRRDGQGTLMCLRCHDGTIATETITGSCGSVAAVPNRWFKSASAFHARREASPRNATRQT